MMAVHLIGKDNTKADPKSQALRKVMKAAAAPFLIAIDEEEEIVLSERRATLVLKLGKVVVKAHPKEANRFGLNARLTLIQQKQLQDLFVQPLRSSALETDENFLTIWPAGESMLPDSPEKVGWEAAARLLASLHHIPRKLFAQLMIPEAGWFPRLYRSYSKLLASKDGPEKRTILSAFSTLPNIDAKEWNLERRCLIHGDWHPGQVVNRQGASRLIDIDDIGIGDPVWDLARPAAWRLSGILSDTEWSRFLYSYLEHGGSTTLGKNPWGSLEVPARAAVIQAAANAITCANLENRNLEDFELDLVTACSRIVKLFSKEGEML